MIRFDFSPDRFGVRILLPCVKSMRQAVDFLLKLSCRKFGHFTEFGSFWQLDY